jgi:hypothetical protein
MILKMSDHESCNMSWPLGFCKHNGIGATELEQPVHHAMQKVPSPHRVYMIPPHRLHVRSPRPPGSTLPHTRSSCRAGYRSLRP